MIVAVKTKSKKRLIIKLLIGALLIIMFGAYYFHMNRQFEQQQKEEAQKKAQLIEENNKKERIKKIERIIFLEAETAVDLVGQRNVLDVKIVANKVLIIVEPNTNLDALKVRYGSTALIKKSINDIKIALDLKYIIESKYDE